MATREVFDTWAKEAKYLPTTAEAIGYKEEEENISRDTMASLFLLSWKIQLIELGYFLDNSSTKMPFPFWYFIGFRRQTE